MAKKQDRQVDIIIPAYKAHGTMLRTLSSIAEQTIKDDLHVCIVNDCCPEGSYKYYVDMFSKHMDIREIVLDKNSGPGVARQKGIDDTSHEFFTCIDADDTFASAIALETMRAGIEEDVRLATGQIIKNGFKCASATFLQMGDTLKQIVPHQNDMVWMFGKIYRRDFIDHYKIRFNETRANEDTGFNTMVKLLCDNPNEQVRFMPEAVYMWHNKEDSITRVNDGQYGYDQCMCGWTDNMIYAIQHVQRERPFSGSVIQWAVSVMFELYYYYVECYARKPVFAEQEWQYVKKYYNTVYKRYEDMISDKVFGDVFSVASTQRWGSGKMMGVLPHIGIKEFMDKLHSDPYNPDDIYDIWSKIPMDLRNNNVACGVCPDNYWRRPKADKEQKEVWKEENAVKQASMQEKNGK